MAETAAHVVDHVLPAVPAPLVDPDLEKLAEVGALYGLKVAV